MPLVWTPAFTRATRRLLRRRPELRFRLQRALELLTEDPFQPLLRSHKLKGDLAEIWACSIDYDNRLLFEFATDPESGAQEIHLLALGSHDAVY